MQSSRSKASLYFLIPQLSHHLSKSSPLGLQPQVNSDHQTMAAFRAPLNHWRSLYRSFTTWKTTPKMKSFAPTAVDSCEETRPAKPKKGWDYVPVYVVLGMIGVSVSLGLYTAMHQLKHSPNVRVSKKKRETLPELEDPDHVVEEADKFLDKSFFRKVAHIQEKSGQQTTVSDLIRGDTFAHPRKAETLKTLGAATSRH